TPRSRCAVSATCASWIRRSFRPYRPRAPTYRPSRPPKGAPTWCSRRQPDPDQARKRARKFVKNRRDASKEPTPRIGGEGGYLGVTPNESAWCFGPVRVFPCDSVASVFLTGGL